MARPLRPAIVIAITAATNLCRDAPEMDETEPRRRGVSRRTLLGGGVIAVSSAAGAGWLLADSPGAPKTQVEDRRAAIGEPAPRFSLTELRTGATVSFPNERLPLLVSFSATWCLTCVAELRSFQEVQGRFTGRGQLAVVNFQQSKQTILNLVDRLDVPDVSIFLDSAGEITRAYGIRALPAMALIDGAGILRAISNEFLSVERIVARMAEVGADPVS